MAFCRTIAAGLAWLALTCAGAPAEERPAADSLAQPPPLARPVASAASAPAATLYPGEAVAPAKPKPKAPPPPPSETVLPTDPTPTLGPDTALATAEAAERYARLAAAGGWPTDFAPLKPGAKGPAVAELRKRLAIEGDLPASAASGGLSDLAWDAELTQAVERFQARMGLRPTGRVVGATLAAINVPAERRAAQLAASVLRLAALNFPFGERYVVVNLPAASVEAVEGGLVARRYAAIVGGVDHPSPEIAAHVRAVDLNPTWTVPVSIIKNEIIPRMQKDPGYLARQKIRILDGKGVEVDPRSINWTTERAASYTLRQDAGAGNSLGAIRIDMPNKLAVYMHDTPSKRLFGADYRFLSHGCVRVQGVYDFAAWLLEGTGGAPLGVWDADSLRAEAKTGFPEEIKLVKPTPVVWIYLTGWANADGRANFRDDVYGVDGAAEATASAAVDVAPIGEIAPARFAPTP
jgi:murein L,D-transpeptidase YcbB/YkuD